jgi:hypothetical protein
LRIPNGPWSGLKGCRYKGHATNTTIIEAASKGGEKMKKIFKWVVIGAFLLLIILLGLISSAKFSTLAEATEDKTNKWYEEYLKKITDLSYFGIIINNKAINIDTIEADLENILGKPENITKKKVNHNPQYKENTYEGLIIGLDYVNSQYYVGSITITGSKYLTSKGIKTGDGLIKVKSTYPGLTENTSEVTGLSAGAKSYIYRIPGYGIQFEMLNNKVAKVSIWSETP